MRNVFILSLFLLMGFVGTAQPSGDTTMPGRQAEAATHLYYQSLKTQSGIYNGSEYVQYTHLLKEGFPYFDTTLITRGNLFYDKMEYADVPMLYDLVTDELILQHFNKVFLIQLVKSKVSWFKIHDHYFVHLSADSLHSPRSFKNGFYDVCYDGKVKLYVKRIKEIQESIPDMKVERKVYKNDRYFIYKDGIYYDVHSQGSVLKVLNNYQGEQKKAVKSKKIRYRRNREAAIRIMVQKFDELSR